jgi:long-chain acyl-CoA synthetase
MTACKKINDVFSSRWNEPALVSDDRRFTYAELYAHAAGMASWMAGQDCHPGDTVALNLPNGWPFALAYLASLLGGYRIVPVNPELSVEDQAYIVALTKPAILLADESVLASVPAQESDAPRFDYADETPAITFFTSGTTGKPKGVCHCLKSLVDNVQRFNDEHGLDVSTRLYHVLPMAYMAGFLNTLLSPWMAGGVVLLGPRFRPAEALTFWQRPLEWGATAIWLTPTLAALLARMSRNPEVNAQVGSSFRQLFCGTAPLSEAIRRSFRSVFGSPLQESYGMSEVLLVSAQTRDEALTTSGVGRLLPGITVSFRIRDDLQARELIIYSPWVLQCYRTDSGESSPLTAEGGMPSGDQGELRGEQLFITGRLKDLIIRGGLNISPVEIEDFLLKESGVEDVAVIGLPHDFWGELIVACLVAGRATDTAQLQKELALRCSRELGDGKRPDRYVWMESLPRSSTGKIQKHVLRESLA